MIHRNLAGVASAGSSAPPRKSTGPRSKVRSAPPRSGPLELIGDTPIVELRKVLADERFRLFAKLESMNLGGSMKDRAAFNMVREALFSGRISRDTTIVESSSGNTAIGLAQACTYWGLRMICVVDTRVTPLNVNIMRAYGAEISLVSEPGPGASSLLEGRKIRVKELLASIPDSYCLNQYANPNNHDAHYQGTMPEIVQALGEDLGYVFIAVSTCGTLRGCSEYLRDQGLPTKVIGVDAKGSVIFGDKPRPRLLPGHGAADMPPIFREGLADDFVLISDNDCVTGCRNLARQEAVLAGASSGGVLAAIHEYRDRIEPGSVVAAILPDRGERYMDTVFCDEWVLEHFGELPDPAEYSKASRRRTSI